jgi:hypothetical protein
MKWRLNSRRAPPRVAAPGSAKDGHLGRRHAGGPRADDCDRPEKFPRKIAVLLDSDRELEAVNRAVRAVQRGHGHLTLLYLIDRCPALLSWEAYNDAFDDLSYAEAWGSELLRRIAQQLPRDVSVSTQLLIHDSKNRAEAALTGGSYELVIVANYASLSRWWRRRLERAFQKTDVRLMAA